MLILGRCCNCIVCEFSDEVIWWHSYEDHSDNFRIYRDFIPLRTQYAILFHSDRKATSYGNRLTSLFQSPSTCWEIKNMFGGLERWTKPRNHVGIASKAIPTLFQLCQTCCFVCAGLVWKSTWRRRRLLSTFGLQKCCHAAANGGRDLRGDRDKVI